MKKCLVWCISTASVFGFIWLGLHFNWSQSEWASWVQAVGSIGAISGAAWIASSTDARSKSHAREVALAKAQILHSDLLRYANDVIDSTDTILGAMRFARLGVAESIVDGRAIQSELLEMETVAAIQTTRHIATQMHEVFRETEEGRNHFERSSEDFKESSSLLIHTLSILVSDLKEVQAAIFLDRSVKKSLPQQ